MDIYTIIHHDHEEIKKLMEKMMSLPETSAERLQLFAQLKEDIFVHNEAKGAAFYAALERNATTKSRVQQARRHQVKMTEMMEKLSADMPPAEWRKAFADVQKALLSYMEEEEGALFAAAHKVLSRQKATQLAATMESFKRQRREALHKAV